MRAESRTARIERCQAKVDERPESAAAHYNLGLAYQTGGRFRLAESSYAEAVRLDPELVEGWVNLGGVRLHLWDFEGCLEASKRAVDLREDLVMAHFNLGQAHLYMNHPEELLQSMQRVLELERDHAAAHYYAAVGELALGNVNAARRHTERASVLGHRPTPDFLKALEKAQQAAGPKPVTIMEITGTQGPDTPKED